jgi:hypothetical protein
MAIKKIKISELPLVQTLTGLFTVGVDALNRSVKVGLEFLQTAAEDATAAAEDANAAAADATAAAEDANAAAADATAAADDANAAAADANAAAADANAAASAGNAAAGAANAAAGAANAAAADATAAAADATAAAAEARGPVPFTEAETLDNIVSGDSTATIFGKLKKWFSSFGALAWKSRANYSTDIDNVPTFKTVFSQLITGMGDITPKLISDVTYDGSTGDVIFSFVDGSADRVINIPADNFLSSAAYYPDTHTLTLTLQGGEEVNVDLGDLIDAYEAAPDGGLEVVNGNQFKILDALLSEIGKKPVQKEIELLVENWTGSSDLWSYTVTDSDVEEGCLFEAWTADRPSKQVALNAEIDDSIIVDDGSFTITCVKKPHSNFSIIYTVL